MTKESESGGWGPGLLQALLKAGVGSERRDWEDGGQHGLCSQDSENGAAAAFDDAGEERDEAEFEPL